MPTMIARVRQNWSVFLGIAVGVVLLPIVNEEWRAWRTDIRIAAEQGTPVVDASAVIIGRDADSVILHVTGTKLRDCKLVGTQAFSVRDSIMTVAKMQRTDLLPIDLTPRPIGPFDMGAVRVWPVSLEADEVVLYALHTCGPLQIEVRSTLARVRLNGPR